MDSKSAFDDFGKKLNDLLREKRMTRAELAKATQMDRSTFSKYCTGRVSPSIYSFVRICKALEVDPSYFYPEIFHSTSLPTLRESQKVILSVYTLAKKGILNENHSIYGEDEIAVQFYAGSILDEVLRVCCRQSEFPLGEDDVILDKLFQKYGNLLESELAAREEE